MSSLDKLSKFISLVLRHKPEAAYITLDEHGWANVEELLCSINNTGRKINMETLEEIVATDNKQRYSFNQDKTLIRTNQGHSIPVDVELKEQEPPEFLYHGTSTRFLYSIMDEGLKPMSRLYIHLSKDIETALKVGKHNRTNYADGNCLQDMIIVSKEYTYEHTTKPYVSIEIKMPDIVFNGKEIKKYTPLKVVEQLQEQFRFCKYIIFTDCIIWYFLRVDDEIYKPDICLIEDKQWKQEDIIWETLKDKIIKTVNESKQMRV